LHVNYLEMTFLFENLDAYRISLQFVEEIYNITYNSDGHRYYKLYSQLTGASLSVLLNIAESNGRCHRREMRHFYYIARGSLCECIPLIELCRRFKIINEESFSKLYKKAEDIGRILSGLIKTVKERSEY